MEQWQDTPQSETSGSASELTSIRFAQIARRLNQVAGECNLRSTAFRSPPRTRGLRRSIRRRPDGSATVSVSLRGRPAVAVVADMIDGVMAANEPGSKRSDAIRDRLWSAAIPLLTADDGRSPAGSRPARRGSVRPAATVQAHQESARKAA